MTDGGAIMLGDCMAPDGLASLAGDSVDVTLTDPPFDQRTHRAGADKASARGRLRTGALPFSPLEPAQIGQIAVELVRVTKRWIVVFAAERQLEAWASAIEAAGGRFVRFGIATKRNPAPFFSGDRPGVGADHLVIGHAAGGRMSWNGRRSAVWEGGQAMFDTGAGSPRGRRQLHPSQKPLDLMRALIEDFTSPGDLVLDPFAGSGTTAIACRELARSFLGWEISAAYHSVAIERIAAAKEGAPLRVPRRRRHLAPAAPAQLALLEAEARR